MGYLHIDNLYKNQDILMFKECFAMEKIHGTSTHISWTSVNGLKFFSGGEKHEKFVQLFDQEKLKAGFLATGANDVTIYGEAYGGSQQGMSYLYGKQLKFIAFDVQIGQSWLSVSDAEQIVKSLGLEFVSYVKISTDVEAINSERDKDSVQAVLNGVDLSQLPEGKTAIREGVVLRPLIELTKNNGARIISKHKSDKFNERSTVQKIIDPAKLVVLEKAEAIVTEWCTYHRLEHIVQKLPENIHLESIPLVIKAMIEDIVREASGEIIDSKEARKAISTKTVILFKQYLQNKLQKDEGISPTIA